MKYENGLFIFRRDLRIIDNTGLIKTVENCEHVYCCFIFTPEQISDKNKYKSNNAIQFMVESLIELNKDLNNKLNIFYGWNGEIIKDLIVSLKIDYICSNRDYTPYAVDRDLVMKL